MIRVRQGGNFKRLEMFLRKAERLELTNILHQYGQTGVRLLRQATPVATGRTALSWGYTIEKTDKNTKLIFVNDNINKGANIAILIQYGHATGTGAYVQGRDYINPALKPLFDALADDIGKELERIG